VAAASGNMKTTMLLLEAGMLEEKGEICFDLVHCPSNKTRCFLQEKRRIPMVGVVVGVVVVLVLVVVALGNLFVSLCTHDINEFHQMFFVVNLVSY